MLLEESGGAGCYAHEVAMNTVVQERSCGEILGMIGRSFDRDLDKRELLTLYHHILRCEVCRVRMTELVDQESKLSAAGRCYEHFSLPADFNQRVLTSLSGLGPSRQKKSTAGVGAWPGLFLNNFQGAFRHRLKPVAVFGAMMVVVGVVTLSWLWTTGYFAAAPARLFIHDVSLQMAKGSVNWNHEQTVPPNYDLYMRVSAHDPQPYFFRLSASAPVKVFLMHTGEHDNTIKRQVLVLTGDRYATLKTPQANDVVLIRNQGGRPLQVNAYASRPDSIRYGIKRSADAIQ
jgi:hypothetical protein